MKNVAICKTTNQQADLAFTIKQEIQSEFKQIFVLNSDPKKFNPRIKINELNTCLMEITEVYCSSCDYNFTIQFTHKLITEDKPYYDMIDETEFFNHFMVIEVFNK